MDSEAGGGDAVRPFRFAGFLAAHTPEQWFLNDQSYIPRLREFRLCIAQLVVFLFMKVLKEAYMSTWSLYGENAEVFGALFIFLGFHFSNVSHNSSNLTATKLYVSLTIIAICLWGFFVIMFGFVIQETIKCASVPKEDYDALQACYQMEPQALGDSQPDCTLGSDYKTRATGTCPGFQFKSEVEGNAWLFFQYVACLFWLASLLLNIIDNVKIIDTLIMINYQEIMQQKENREASIERYRAKRQEVTTNGREFRGLRHRGGGGE